MRLERRTEPLVGEERRVDAASEVAQVVDRPLGLRLELGEHLMGLAWITVHEGVCEPELHTERHQLLLRAVMDVPFELASLLVLGGDEPLSRRAQLLDQADVPQHRACLRGEVAHEPLPRRIERIVRRHRSR